MGVGPEVREEQFPLMAKLFSHSLQKTTWSWSRFLPSYTLEMEARLRNRERKSVCGTKRNFIEKVASVSVE